MMLILVNTWKKKKKKKKFLQNWLKSIVTEPKKEEMEEKLQDQILFLPWVLTELLRQTLKRKICIRFCKI